VYWRLVGEFHDFRYFPPGLAFHLIWAASACVITIPLGKELQQYAKYRRNALAELAAARHCSAAPDKLPQLSELSADMDRVHPKATLGVAFAGVTSLISLLAPLLQLLKK
jgi:hypothetical protein